MALPLPAYAGQGLSGARQFESFRVYFPGKGVLGLELHSIEIFGEGRKAEVMAFYGECEQRAAAKAAPIRLKSGRPSICRTYPDIYFSPPKLRRLNGAWGGWFWTARIFDVYTGRSATSIFGVAENRAIKVARELRNVRRSQRRDRLRDVKPKLLEGQGRCQHGPGVAPPPG